jgi:hypothetical protein
VVANFEENQHLMEIILIIFGMAKVLQYRGFFFPSHIFYVKNFGEFFSLIKRNFGSNYTTKTHFFQNFPDFFV